MGRRVTFRAGLPGAEREIEVEVHDLDAEPWGIGADLRLVGTDVPRVDGPAKVAGTARFTMDARPEGMAWAGFAVSPHAHARVRGVDAAAARAIPGVLAVKTNEGRRITYAGQIVGAVCADTPEILEDALRALRVDYEVLPHAVTVQDALAPGAPSVSEETSGPPPADTRASRDPEGARRALAEAEVEVSGTWRTQVQTHSALEPHGTVCAPDGDGGATVWASTQATGSIAPGLFRSLGVPRGRVRVISEHVGGGFGAKFGVQPWDLVVAEFARETGRPVHGMLPRRQEHLVGGNRPDSEQELTLAGRRDGTITALLGRTRGTAGNARGGAGCTNTRVYAIPAVDMAQATVPTFTQRGTAFRAPGHPQGVFALEGAVEAFARAAGLDPLEVRLKNDPHPVRRIQWRLGAERIGWAEHRRRGPGGEGEGPWKRGQGCAASIWYQAGRPNWNVDLRVERDGTVTVMNGAQDIGTGTRTVLAVLAAEELGVDVDRVQVRLGDTTFPPGPGSGGSTTAPSLGPAAREAGLRAREALEDLLAREWGVEPDRVRGEAGLFLGPDGRRATFEEAASLVGDEGLLVRGTRRPNYEGFHRETAGCQFAQVAVDVETGVIRVERVVAVHDCGRVIDALTARSQVNGGVIQGLSYALYEERRLDRNLGDMVNPTFDTYRIAGVHDVPPIDVLLTSVASGFNNAGMMGLGEPVTVPTAAAIANAVYDAIGVQVRTLPMTPARVLAALGKG